MLDSADQIGQERTTNDGPIIPRATDFAQWYQDIIAAAELVDQAPVRGCYILRPNGYFIWESIQRDLDARFKQHGVQNAYFPLLIPMSFIMKEAEHVEGFAPELAVVTHGGGEALEEPLVVRPTSETVIWSTFRRWIRSHRDLPLLLNQWCNVLRWEKRPRAFLRTAEFLWQEGHTAHASFDDAATYARKIHHEVYNDFIQNVLGVQVYLGIKSKSERFAGATNTMTCEGLMRDGKALQMATSHELGQNFAKAFDIKFQDESGTAAHCYTTSWGASTRLIGGLIMSHGDDNGLVVPPRLAPIQAVVLAVRDEESVNNAAEEISRQLLAAGIRVRTDHGRGSFGRRVTDWEIKGVPVRVEVGPRDLAEGLVTLARRDTGDKIQVRLEEAPARIVTLLEEIQQSILESSRSALASRTVDVSSIAEAAEAANEGFARLGWDLVKGEGEASLRMQAITVRCLQRADGSMPDNEDEAGLVAIVAKSY